MTKDFGFDAVACGGWTGMGAERAYRFYFNTWPADWLEFYGQRQVFTDDPLVDEAQRRSSPFLWREAGGASERGHEIYAAAYEYGWADGMVVPVHGPAAGYHGMISLAAFHRLDLSDAERALLWVTSLALHDRCRTTPGMGESASASTTLTRRELQCFGWVAAGKTDWEIGQLLGIAPSTVHYHVERVKRRLGTRSRTQAVALLVLHGAL